MRSCKDFAKEVDIGGFLVGGANSHHEMRVYIYNYIKTNKKRSNEEVRRTQDKDRTFKYSMMPFKFIIHESSEQVYVVCFVSSVSPK